MTVLFWFGVSVVLYALAVPAVFRLAPAAVRVYRRIPARITVRVTTATSTKGASDARL